MDLWTDGACLQNPDGPGGWGYVALEDSAVIHTAYGGEESTTNNRMEMTAVLEAMRYAAGRARSIKIYTDSQLVAKCFKGVWRRKKNLDIWDDMLEIAENFEKVDIQWVKAHAGIEHNEMADELANRGAQEVLEQSTDMLALDGFSVAMERD